MKTEGRCSILWQVISLSHWIHSQPWRWNEKLWHPGGSQSGAAVPPYQEESAEVIQTAGQHAPWTWGAVWNMSSQEETLEQTQNTLKRLHSSQLLEVIREKITQASLQKQPPQSRSRWSEKDVGTNWNLCDSKTFREKSFEWPWCHTMFGCGERSEASYNITSRHPP